MRKCRYWLAICAAAATVASLPAAQAQCMRQSPAHSVALMELYTSEGCDSCPRADRWLSGIGPTHSPHSIVPLALHVDYWDRLGWKDRFADARFSERQSELARLAKGRVIYTPGVFMNLREFRVWDSSGQFDKAVKEANARPARAAIKLALASPGAGRVMLEARFALVPGVAAARPEAYVVLYENGLQTEVKAGENRGATLRHDHVVRLWMGPIALNRGMAEYTRLLDISPEWKRANLGVAAFVQDSAGPDVLQATALRFCS